MYVKINGQLKAIKRIELTSDSKTIVLRIETGTGKEEVCHWPCGSPSFYHLRKLFSSEIYIPSDIVCGNQEFIIWMTITLLNIDNQHQIFVSTIFNNITKKFRVITEWTNDEQITAFICTPGSLLYSFIAALFKNWHPVQIKIQDGKFYMTTIFLEINDEIYIIKSLTYNIKTKSYKIDTEKSDTWEKATFSCPSESTNFSFFESLCSNPPPVKIVSMYQTIWIFNTSRIESNKNHFRSTWWQQDTFENWQSLQVDTTFPARRILYNYELFGYRTEVSYKSDCRLLRIYSR